MRVGKERFVSTYDSFDFTGVGPKGSEGTGNRPCLEEGEKKGKRE